MKALVTLLVVLVSLVLPGTASAFTAIGAGTCTGGVDVAGRAFVGVLGLVGPEKHRGNVHEYGETASGSSNAARGASSALKGAQLSRHLAQLEKYGSAGFKELQNGRIRYFGELQNAGKQGGMAGRRLVREWNPATNATRTWHETLDHAGRVRIVRPETGGPKVHYMFDELGNFTGTF